MATRPNRRSKPVTRAEPSPKVQLTEKYRPRTLGAFLGIDGPRKIIGQLAAQPVESAWYFLGPSGVGKTSLGFALANAIRGELYHIPSKQCDLNGVEKLMRRCAYVPMGGGWHVVVIDEADQMSRAAQLAFLSVLDGAAQPKQTIFIFTANDTRLIEDRFLSRCRLLRFDSRTLADPVPAYLADIWRKEGGAEPAPDFAALFRKSGSNLRTALMNLELLLVDPTLDIPELPGPVAVPVKMPASVDRRAAALKAWETMRRRKAELEAANQ